MQRILIATDFSPHAERAAEHGVAFARRFGAEVEFLTCLFISPMAFLPFAISLPLAQTEQAEAQVRDRLEALAGPLRAEGLSVSSIVATDVPSVAICSRAGESEADLIVMGTHGHTGLPHVLLGSVAERTVRLAPCPVLTVHRDSPEPGPIGKVLVATDFSMGAEAALGWARALIARTGAGLILTHCIPPPFGIPEAEVFSGGVAGTAREADARERMEQLARGEDCQVEVVVVRGHPDTAGLEVAKAHGADLIVVGTRGLTGLPHVLLGSTAERIIRRSRVPVVSVKVSG